MKYFALIIALVLSACGGSPGTPSNAAAVSSPNLVQNGGNDEQVPSQSAGCLDPAEARMPATPANGESRTGLNCGIHLPIPADPEIPGQPSGVIAFQVFEPATLTGGDSYPLILDGHGFSASRARQPSDTGTAGLTVPTGPIVRGGYGMISIDQAGHGETGGLIRIMDNDQEGKFLIAILDWAEENLDWLAYGPDADAALASDPVAAANANNNLLLGAIGPSYGGGYQHLLHAVDPKKRLDVIVPQITWHDLSYSIFPGTVPKSAWGGALFALGNQAGNELERGNFDPFVQRTFAEALSQANVSEAGLQYFRYHGLGYFCDGNAGRVVASNGDDGSIDTAGTPYNVDFPQPTAEPTQVHALYFQGMRDVLFNFNEAYLNYECLFDKGGDVRLLTYQSGHNTIPVVQDPGVTPDNSLIGTCGDFDPTSAALAFFDKYLKGVPGDIDPAILPPGEKICMSLEGTDAVLIDRTVFPKGVNNTTEFVLPDTVVVSGLSSLTPAIVTYDFDTQGDVLAGIPLVDISVDSACAQFPINPITDAACADPLAGDNVVIFVGVAVNTGQGFELADNQVLPLRGTGTHTVEMIGIGERLSSSSQIGLAIYGLNDQFAAEGSLNAADPIVMPLTISGSIHMPLVDSSTL